MIEMDIENTYKANTENNPKLVGGGKSILDKFLCCCGNSIFIIGISVLIVWWIYAVPYILLKIQESFRTNPGDWSTAFFIAISLLPTLIAVVLYISSCFLFSGKKNDDEVEQKITRCASFTMFLVASCIITVWYTISYFFILEPLQNTYKENPNDWSLAFFVFISFGFTLLNIILCCFGIGYMFTAEDGCFACSN